MGHLQTEEKPDNVRRILPLPEHGRCGRVVDDVVLLRSFRDVQHFDRLDALVPRARHQIPLGVSRVANDTRHLRRQTHRESIIMATKKLLHFKGFFVCSS